MPRAINPELLSALKRLRLGRIADTLAERLVPLMSPISPNTSPREQTASVRSTPSRSS